MDQYATDMLAFFWRVMKVDNQYPKVIKAQMFVQGLRPDLSLAVGLFMPNTLQEAIDRARVCEMTFTQEVAVCGPAAIYNTISGTSILQQPSLQQQLSTYQLLYLQPQLPFQQPSIVNYPNNSQLNVIRTLNQDGSMNQ
ncbi:4088_t:CDS:1, partial [Cetraspora pellucida]